MHLLAAQPGRVSDGSDAVDLGQDPADILFLSAADTEIACLAAARAAWAEAPSLRAANLTRLGHPMSVDLWIDDLASRAKLVVVRLLGGRGYWPHGVDSLADLARTRGLTLALLPGDANPDVELARLSTLPRETLHRLWRYWVEGGIDNAGQFLRCCAELIGRPTPWRDPVPLPVAGLLGDEPDAADGRSGVALVFYRALVQAGDLAPITALRAALEARGLRVVALYCTSLKDPLAAATVETVLLRQSPAVIINFTGFAVSAPGAPRVSPLAGPDAPVLQAILAASDEIGWRQLANGLIARDIAMNVALPEVDGRILSRAISFKALDERDEALQTTLTRHRPVADRVDFVAALAANWARLRATAPGERRVALILANYPNRDGRVGNGVGLDTPAATVRVLRALEAAGYGVEGAPGDGAGLMERLLRQGPTNALGSAGRSGGGVLLPLAAYQAFLAALPGQAGHKVTERWGRPEEDPFYVAGRGGFVLPLAVMGRVVVGIQPARGYNLDPVASYHDPALPPPHGYLAFHAWLRASFDVHAIVHMGKHGNLEWLPGKAVALSQDCFPEAALGPLPHLYPFIVNDPGEGTQAKRRSQAVIIDHLTPPLTRAETYGVLRDLERLVDEFYEAASIDPRRLGVLKRAILDLAENAGLLADLGLGKGINDEDALSALDNHLCDLKEMQIRDGLHVFGDSPVGRLRTDLLVALARGPRGAGAANESLTRALARDLGLGAFDPLAATLAEPWQGPRPDALADQVEDPWRTAGDTVERLEYLASALVSGARPADPAWPRTAAVLDTVFTTLGPAVDACGPAEIAGLLSGLDGRFVDPGPSGAPSRGRPDVLPTGRNFYSVDNRTVPTPAAWTLGWKAANLLLERHLQDHGDWPRSLVLTAWGTSTMRTGGDDIAQTLALMGVQTTWDPMTRRVTGFEIMPLSVLDRPRVDVTLRISGFFRDAFPGLVDLVDSAARAVAAQDDEPADLNPLAQRVREETQQMVRSGIEPALARRRAGHRVFGARPGAYGAGLQALIDERGWETDADLARAYIAWGGYAYGDGAAGDAAHGQFQRRLAAAEAVVQNQDNREHDLLDSDDYYQFEGGAAAAVRVLSGNQPAIYHGDTSRTDSPRIRTLTEEIARVVRARVVNPKWIRGAMRHGYKGAFEMAATVDYLFAFAATARVVKDHQFDLVAEAYLLDPEVRGFLRAVNPDALAEMARRLREALDRGLWRSRRNDMGAVLAALAEGQEPS
ncbi:cobaltochelatase subunit CobN [Rhodospirillum rubrum]|uniref:Cobaltochelatase subunit CobN n=1 Tax=Rhodospirillum rubrum (strain ATCC 11170 / ATH 1.1.1 / DSM 467 / LMG 4362 / NCIMB 8255 / S1) TaxID=269796 RepID=Q2RNY5_RHORT|nr:cobaltochelatase subunit CobN [Rhodospirillum rubrum]ABC24160.1 hydrogenobyrinic acid a,c-diamide cobaltochelatase [Rhodospirillum rubrum ATCC 11170]AEO49911.1 cobaltochelatase subunit CobN [Rhodospirillum rubrum F11]MBK5955873.1 cobaltochelatase subunit CobN [Rhodospirillum rubrum]QXG80100.1 cobaltochelatase subunit CobN [Rhodospirillum rubrum]HCF18945.1 cobaltochelatase subunit CobN [Rhodospirillum rubrum]